MTVEGKVVATNVIGTSTGDTLINRNPYLYRGYRYDRETGLYYLNSRYYDPETGRFLNADVFVSTGQGVLGNNMFAYCLNNPVNGTDPSGMFDWGGFLAGIVTVAAGIAVIATGGLAAVPIGAVVTTTGAVMTTAAATDSAMVMDFSVAIPTTDGYRKFGGYIVYDFGTDTGGLYYHEGYGVGYVGIGRAFSYSVGIVDNMENPEDYAGPFEDMFAAVNLGIEHCYDPRKPYETATKATTITFSPGFSGGGGHDEYFIITTVMFR